MSLPIKFDDFQLAFSKAWTEYCVLHKELDKFRGKEIGDDLVEVNRLLHAIQEKFTEIFPSLNWAIQRNSFAINACKDYETFIEALKTTGAHQEPSEAKA